MRIIVSEFDIDRPAPIWGAQPFSLARVLVRKAGRPLGFIEILLDQQVDVIPVHVLSSAAMEQFEDQITAAAPDPHELPPITVAVCTRDRHVALRWCLASLRNLDYPVHEVLVVDNNSKTGATREVTAQAGFRYVREEKPGLDSARNCALQHATYGIVAYTDDDVRVDPSWLKGIARGFAHGDAACVTGLICPLEMGWSAQIRFEQYGGMGKGVHPKLFDPAEMTPAAKIATHDLGAGANMAFRRSVALELGGFDPCLDVGTPSNGAGDLDMFHRLLTRGYKARYEPSALVWHQHRRSIEALYKQIYNNGRAFGCYLIKIGATGSVPSRDLLSFAVRRWFGGWILGSLGDPNPGRGFGLIGAELLGAIYSPWAYLRTYRKLPARFL